MGELKPTIHDSLFPPFEDTLGSTFGVVPEVAGLGALVSALLQQIRPLGMLLQFLPRPELSKCKGHFEFLDELELVLALLDHGLRRSIGKPLRICGVPFLYNRLCWKRRDPFAGGGDPGAYLGARKLIKSYSTSWFDPSVPTLRPVKAAIWYWEHYGPTAAVQYLLTLAKHGALVSGVELAEALGDLAALIASGFSPAGEGIRLDGLCEKSTDGRLTERLLTIGSWKWSPSFKAIATKMATMLAEEIMQRFEEIEEASSLQGWFYSYASFFVFSEALRHFNRRFAIANDAEAWYPGFLSQIEECECDIGAVASMLVEDFKKALSLRFSWRYFDALLSSAKAITNDRRQVARMLEQRLVPRILRESLLTFDFPDNENKSPLRADPQWNSISPTIAIALSKILSEPEWAIRQIAHEPAEISRDQMVDRRLAECEERMLASHRSARSMDEFQDDVSTFPGNYLLMLEAAIAVDEQGIPDAAAKWLLLGLCIRPRDHVLWQSLRVVAQRLDWKDLLLPIDFVHEALERLNARREHTESH